MEEKWTLLCAEKDKNKPIVQELTKLIEKYNGNSWFFEHPNERNMAIVDFWSKEDKERVINII